MDTGGAARSLNARIPPQLTDIEELCLGAVLFEPESIVDIIGVLQPLDFFIYKHQLIYAAMLKCVEKRLPCNPTFVAVELTSIDKIADVEGEMHLHYLSVLPEAHSSRLKDFGRLIKQMSIRRETILGSRDLVKIAWDVSVPFDAFMEQRAERIQKLSEARIAPERRRMRDLVLEGFLDASVQRERPWSTGIGALDNILTGYLPGTLNVIAGRPGWGKSALGTQIIWHIAKVRQLATAIISYEMTAEDIRDRMVALEADIDMYRFQHEDHYRDQHMSIWADTYGVLEPLPITVVDDISSQLHVAVGTMLGMVQDDDVKVVMVDYLGLMQAAGRHQSRTTELSVITSGLKQFAMQHKVAILLLAQMNREIERRTNQRPMLADLRDSGSIEQDADTVTFIHRPDLLEHDEAGESEPNVAQFFVEKNRRGPIDHNPVRFIPYRTKFVSYTEGT